MKTEEIEDGDVCPYCGVLAIFFEGEEEVICPSCGSHLFNSAVPHDILPNDLDDEEVEIVRDEEAGWEEADRTDFGDPEIDGNY
jgi:uncharacterized Zn finger protein (UPF0148 family)